jgi:hypothetical protein
MPGGDRTGPMGMGAMTGRRTGNCAGRGMPGYANPVSNRGFGRGPGGGGLGRRRGLCAAWGPGRAGYAGPAEFPPQWKSAEPALETQGLRNQAETLQTALDDIRRRLAKIEGEPETG